MSAVLYNSLCLQPHPDLSGRGLCPGERAGELPRCSVGCTRWPAHPAALGLSVAALLSGFRIWPQPPCVRKQQRQLQRLLAQAAGVGRHTRPAKLTLRALHSLRHSSVCCLPRDEHRKPRHLAAESRLSCTFDAPTCFEFRSDDGLGTRECCSCNPPTTCLRICLTAAGAPWACSIWRAFASAPLLQMGYSVLPHSVYTRAAGWHALTPQVGLSM